MPRSSSPLPSNSRVNDGMFELSHAASSSLMRESSSAPGTSPSWLPKHTASKPHAFIARVAPRPWSRLDSSGVHRKSPAHVRSTLGSDAPMASTQALNAGSWSSTPTSLTWKMRSRAAGRSQASCRPSGDTHASTAERSAAVASPGASWPSVLSVPSSPSARAVLWPVKAHSSRSSLKRSSGVTVSTLEQNELSRPRSCAIEDAWSPMHAFWASASAWALWMPAADSSSSSASRLSLLTASTSRKCETAAAITSWCCHLRTTAVCAAGRESDAARLLPRSRSISRGERLREALGDGAEVDGLPGDGAEADGLPGDEEGDAHIAGGRGRRSRRRGPQSSCIDAGCRLQRSPRTWREYPRADLLTSLPARL